LTIRIVNDGPGAVVGGHDGTVRVWDLLNDRQLGGDLALPLPVTALACAPNGRRVAGFDREVVVFHRL
jgi:hypothetical protein